MADSPDGDPIKPDSAAEAATTGGDADERDAVSRTADSRPLSLSIDAMSGDDGPKAVVEALAATLKRDEEIARSRLLLHGDADRIESLAKRAGLDLSAVELRHCDGVVEMDQTPRQALREGRDSSMWLAIDAVAQGEADAAVSAGNTGAMMTMATMRLRPIQGIARPAIAVLWPALNRGGYNIVLDVGADIRVDAQNLVDYAILGAEYARIVLGAERPRVGLLNIGSEEMKGLPALREAAGLLQDAFSAQHFAAEFVGFIEADQIASTKADVVVTDGFTGNVALKSAEGAARLVAHFMRDAFTKTWLHKLGALAATPALRDLKLRMDPRRVNGGVFLGLNGVVVKSHGGSDAVGFASALKLAARMGRRDIVGRIAAQVAKLERDPKDRPKESAAV